MQSSGPVSSAGNTSLNEPIDSDNDHPRLVVHSTQMSYNSVDVFHAYCALAVVRHRLTVDSSQCTLNCCKDNLTAYDIAGLGRLLLWDVDVRRRRCTEELVCIRQLQTMISINKNKPSTEYDNSGANANQDTAVGNELPSSQDETTTCISADLVNECGVKAVDTAEVNTETAIALVQQCHSDWQTLPIDVKYSQHELSLELLDQEANRLQYLCDDTGHHLVSTGSFVLHNLIVL